MGELLGAEKIDFYLLNQGQMALLFPCPDALMIKSAIESLKFTTSYHFPKDHLGLLCHYLLFTTTHWNEDKKDRLQEKVRIKAIEEECVSCIECATGISSSNLDILLGVLQLLSARKCIMVEPTVHKCFPESQLLTSGEAKWINNIKELLFTQIFQNIKFDSAAIKRFFDVHAGERHLEKQVMMESTGMEIKRLQQLLLTGLELDLKTINPKNYGLCAIASAAKSDHLPTFKDQLLFHGIIDNDAIEEFDSFLSSAKVSKFEGIEVVAAFIEDPKKLFMLKEKVASFLQDTNLYLLVILYLLTRGSTNVKTAGWNAAIERLLSKHFRYLCGTSDIGQYIDIFKNQFLAFSSICEKVVHLISSNVNQ